MGTFKKTIDSADSKQFGDHKMTLNMLKNMKWEMDWQQMFVGDQPSTSGVRAPGAGSQAEHGEGEQEELKQGP